MHNLCNLKREKLGKSDVIEGLRGGQREKAESKSEVTSEGRRDTVPAVSCGGRSEREKKRDEESL